MVLAAIFTNTLQASFNKTSNTIVSSVIRPDLIFTLMYLVPSITPSQCPAPFCLGMGNAKHGPAMPCPLSTLTMSMLLLSLLAMTSLSTSFALVPSSC